jgi:type II secretory pathway component PulF
MRRSVAAVMRAFDDGRDRSEFYRGWRAGHSAGLAHPTILAQVFSGAQGGLTKAARDHLLEGTRAGRDIASLVLERPELFEPFESALLRMAEETGKLESVLGALADFHFRQYKLILKVKQWMSYPLFLSLVAVVITPLPLIFYGQTGAYVVTVLGGLAGWFLLGGGVFAGLAQRYQRRPAFVRARLARTLAVCVESGLPLGRAAVLAAEASGDRELVHHVRRFGERALTSQPLSVTFANTSVATQEPLFITSLQMAERTGDYTTTLRKLATLYEDGFK